MFTSLGPTNSHPAIDDYSDLVDLRGRLCDGYFGLKLKGFLTETVYVRAVPDVS